MSVYLNRLEKSNGMFILYIATLAACFVLTKNLYNENILILTVFVLMASGIPLIFEGFRPSFLWASLQFFNYYWYRYWGNVCNEAIIFIVCLSTLPLIGIAYKEKIKKWYLRKLYLITALIIVFCGIEVALRFSTLHNFLDVGVGRWDFSSQLYSHTNLFINHDAGAAFTDSVSREFSVGKRDGIYRIICLGSSSTQGHGAGLSSYPVRLGHALARQGKEVEVINAGVGGFQFHQLYIYFKDILLKLNPDLLIVYFAYNDDSYQAYRYYNRVVEILKKHPYINNLEDLRLALNFRYCSKSMLTVYRCLFSSKSVEVLKIIWDNIGNNIDLTETERQSFKRSNINALVELCKANKISLLLIPELIMYDNGEYSGYFKEKEDISNNVFFYQVDRSKLERYLTDSIHLTKDGYNELANQIADFLLEGNIF